MTKKPRIVESTLEFPYSRSLGPVVGAFLAGLKEHRILGIRTRDGKVLVPPLEYDPNTGDALDELVEVGPEGTVGSWTWVDEPTPKHPLDQPVRVRARHARRRRHRDGARGRRGQHRQDVDGHARAAALARRSRTT